MAEAFTQLLILQDRDLRKITIERELENIPREADHIEKTLISQSAAYEAHKASAQKLEVERKELDNEVKSKEALIEKYRNQQLQTKKNEEYQALSHEIERAQKEISDLEDRELELMEQVDAAMKEVQTESIQVEAYRKAAEERRHALREKETNLQSALKSLTAEIQTLEQQCDPALLKRYRRIFQSKGDVAIVQVESGKFCGGCHMALTQQDILLAKGGKESACANCGRLLYYQSEFA